MTIVQKGKALSSMTNEDCIEYRDFLADPRPRALVAAVAPVCRSACAFSAAPGDQHPEEPVRVGTDVELGHVPMSK